MSVGILNKCLEGLEKFRKRKVLFQCREVRERMINSSDSREIAVATRAGGCHVKACDGLEVYWCILIVQSGLELLDYHVLITEDLGEFRQWIGVSNALREQVPECGNEEMSADEQGILEGIVRRDDVFIREERAGESRVPALQIRENLS